ncbi:DUF6844 domain-containing protein [Motiliproteus sp.]|uniref:DUF6844 domain-containing protein n=1 Tax=Motiliproteus sp. TaxID=1898955 RepID=UPI003BAADC86
MKLNTNKGSVALLVSALLFSPSYLIQAKEMTGEAQVEAEIIQAAQPELEDPGLKIEALLEDFETNGMGQRFVARADRGELYYTTAIATVMAKPENRDWGNYRVMAYKEALLKAQAKYVESLGVSIRTESVQKLFDDKTQMPSFTAEELRSSSKMMELLNKAVAYAGGVLDQKLEELGIDPTEFNAAPPEKRALMFERSVSERTISKARQSITGVIPVKTFEAYDSQGNHVVAVAIVASPRFREFVEDVINSKGDIAPKPERAADMSILAQLRGDKKALIDEFGIRRLYDEEGYPVLVSFGQSSNPYRGTDYQTRADNRDLSYASAKAQSYANFAYLFKSSASSNEASSQKAKRTKVGVARKDNDGVTNTEEFSVDFIRTIDREITAQGKVNNLPGTKELFRWTEKHPIHGHEINGVVYIWSPKLEQTARNLKNFKPKKQVAATAKAKTNANLSAGTSSSADRMRADDF